LKKEFILFLIMFYFQNSYADSTDVKIQKDRIKKSAIGIEFYGSASTKRIFKYNGITFSGIKTDSLGQSYYVDPKIANSELEAKYPFYDIGIFFRYEFLKIGWLPTAKFREKFITDHWLTYNEEPEYRLSGFDIEIETFNLFYFEIYGLKVNDIEKSNIYANLVARFDKINISGSLLTYKYPFGDEWYQEPIVIHDEKIKDKFILLSIGPKISFDFKTNNILGNNPLKYFKGVDLLVSFDVPLKDSKYKSQNHYIIGSLVLELPI